MYIYLGANNSPFNNAKPSNPAFLTLLSHSVGNKVIFLSFERS